MVEAPCWAPELPPTIDELITDDGEPMETNRHRQQMNLLIEILEHHWRDRTDTFVSGNMFVYFSLAQVRKNQFRGPDFFAVTGTEKGDRKAWVTWLEGGKLPDVVIELLSESTAANDRGEKKRLYEQVWRLPEYFLFDPWTGELEGYRMATHGFVPIAREESGRLPSTQLGLELGVWRGEVAGTSADWLRWFSQTGELLPMKDEIIQAEIARAEAETARAEDLARQLADYQRKHGPLSS
jgi:Uma2 family endonuclease